MIYQYDGSNESCPLPLVKTRVLLKKMKQSDKCIIRIADQGSLTDIPKYLISKGYEFSQVSISPTIVELQISTGKL